MGLFILPRTNAAAHRHPLPCIISDNILPDPVKGVF